MDCKKHLSVAVYSTLLIVAVLFFVKFYQTKNATKESKTESTNHTTVESSFLSVSEYQEPESTDVLPIQNEIMNGILSVKKVADCDDGTIVTVKGQVTFITENFLLLQSLEDDIVSGIRVFDPIGIAEGKHLLNSVVNLTGTVSYNHKSPTLTTITSQEILEETAIEIPLVSARAVSLESYIGKRILLQNVLITPISNGRYKITDSANGTVQLYEPAHFPDTYMFGTPVDLICTPNYDEEENRLIVFVSQSSDYLIQD